MRSSLKTEEVADMMSQAKGTAWAKAQRWEIAGRGLVGAERSSSPWSW